MATTVAGRVKNRLETAQDAKMAKSEINYAEASVTVPCMRLDVEAWQVRSYLPDPTKVMILVGQQRWLFDADRLLDAIRQVAGKQD